VTQQSELVTRVGTGDRGALARMLTLVERGGQEAAETVAALPKPGSRAATVGITGAPGAGKSTLTDRLVESLRGSGDRVAVLAVDPSSPYTGGAILGDRVRMQGHATDDGVFIRSMASRGQLGGLSVAAPQAVRVLDAAGFAWVVVETVGVGQAEVDVAALADTTVVVVTPGWGDGVQAAKAGLLEIADVFVVNKVDRPGADETVRDLEAMLGLTAAPLWTPPVLRTVATENVGIDDVRAAISRHCEHLVASGEGEARRRRRIAEELRGLVVERLTAAAAELSSGERFDALVDAIAADDRDPWSAAAELAP
jgi:LAO/AO transport system kinase